MHGAMKSMQVQQGKDRERHDEETRGRAYLGDEYEQIRRKEPPGARTPKTDGAGRKMSSCRTPCS